MEDGPETRKVEVYAQAVQGLLTLERDGDKRAKYIEFIDIYAAMDWLLERQDAIERRLAKRHLADGALVLYDLTSSYLEGRRCPLARRGHSRDGKRPGSEPFYTITRPTKLQRQALALLGAITDLKAQYRGGLKNDYAMLYARLLQQACA